MAEEDNVLRRALEGFPKLYYFFPITSRVIKLPSVKVQIDEPLDAILWVVELLSEDTCLQGEVQAIVRWWYPQAAFARSLRYLVRTGCIEQTPFEQDLRKKILTLTPTGKMVLDEIKSDRQEFMRLLFEQLSEREVESIIPILERISSLAWKTLRERSRQR